MNFSGYFATILDFFYKNDNQILNVIIKFHDVNCPLEAGHVTNVEEPISVIVVLVCSKHIGQHVFGCFDAEGPVRKISYEFFWLFGNHLGIFFP